MNNILHAKKAGNAESPEIIEASKLSADFLRDESKMQGTADNIAFPTSTEELSAIMKWASSKKMNITVSGGRTGIAGGAVPSGGMLLSLSKMKKTWGLEKITDGEMSVRCQGGVLLSELQNYLIMKKCPCFFPPDPTETGASIGGMIACNASGAHTFKYGPTRDYVNAVTAVLYNGDTLELRRGEHISDDNGKFSIRFSDGRETACKVPDYVRPTTKNAAGYFSGRKIDLIDLLIGSEGTLAIIAEAELKLIIKPELEYNVMFFLSSEKTAVELTEKLRSDKNINVTAIEYFDPAALALLRRTRAERGAASAVPPSLPDASGTAGIYIDIVASKKNVKDIVAHVNGISAHLKTGNMIAAWAAFDRDERERLRKFRHALPETVNSIIAERRRSYPKLTKLGTDMAVPDKYLSEILDIYRKSLDSNSLEYVIFGHIGNNHLHVNILPENPDQYDTGKKLYLDFAKEVLKMNGSVSAEHGIGKLKKNFLAMMFGEDGIRQMKNVKKAFDPYSLLNEGALF